MTYMDSRMASSAPQRVPVVCPKCKTRNEFTVASNVPVEQCPTCGFRLTLRTNRPMVVSR